MGSVSLLSSRQSDTFWHNIEKSAVSKCHLSGVLSHRNNNNGLTLNRDTEEKNGLSFLIKKERKKLLWSFVSWENWDWLRRTSFCLILHFLSHQPLIRQARRGWINNKINVKEISGYFAHYFTRKVTTLLCYWQDKAKVWESLVPTDLWESFGRPLFIYHEDI